MRKKTRLRFAMTLIALAVWAQIVMPVTVYAAGYSRCCTPAYTKYPVTPVIIELPSLIVSPYVSPYLNTQAVVIQEALTPAFVFQVYNPYVPVTNTVYTAPVNTNPGITATPVQQSQQGASLLSGMTPAQMKAFAKEVALQLRAADMEDSLPNLLSDGPPDLGGTRTPEPPPPPQPRSQLNPMAVDYYRNNCAACHSTETRGGAKGKLVLFDKGQWSPHRMDGKSFDQGLLLTQVRDQVMPPGIDKGTAAPVPKNIVDFTAQWVSGQ